MSGLSLSQEVGSKLKDASTKIKDGGEKVVKRGKDVIVQVVDTTKSAGRAVIAPIGHLVKHLDKNSRTLGEQGEPELFQEGDLPPLPPDDILKTMDIILSKRLKGLTIPQFYQTVWAEHADAPLYEPWLKASGKNDITVSEWESSEAPYTGMWDGETTYDQRRFVQFQFTRTTHLYTGPPVASVKHTHYCRVEGEDKCVLAMTIEMEGIPFADCFKVQIRWVATRMGTWDTLKIQVGLDVDFVKQTILASKIRSGTSEETTKAQLSLFAAIKKACAQVAGGRLEEEEEQDMYHSVEEEESPVSCFVFSHLLNKLFSKHRTDAIAVKAQSAETRLQKFQDLWDRVGAVDADSHVIESELTDIHASLDKIMKELNQ